MCDEQKLYSDDYIAIGKLNKLKTTEGILKNMDTWKDRFIKLVNKINKKRGWSSDDMNPFFYQINLLNFSNAKTLREYKKQIKGYK